ncbi:helix-turn-helix domain-containing protein [Bacillus timonensis]|uniref:helix-turn-helix domain-containing protein n=1 Tax=Bacillus timonensis TaxID=1033734 RepID=UPI0002890A15|nr:helix-turn-helix domain-containing protein [Bacillus timonensis]
MRSLKEYPDVLKVEDVKGYLGIGKEQAYNLVNSGVFHTVRAGRRILIYKKVFENWLQGQN